MGQGYFKSFLGRGIWVGVFSIAILVHSSLEAQVSNPVPVQLPEDFSLNLEMLELHGTKMLLIDPNTGYILRANQSARKFYGYEALVGKNIQDINTFTPEKTKKEMEDAVKQNRNYFNFKHRTADGRIKSVKVYSYPIYYNDKPILFSIIHDVSSEERREQFVFNIFLIVISVFLVIIVFYLMSNIAKRRKVEEELRTIQSSLENAQEIGNIGSWEYDRASHKMIWSKNFYKMVGMEPYTVNPSYSLFLQSIHTEDVKKVKQCEDDMSRLRKPVEVEVRYRVSSSAEIRWGRIYMVPYFLNNNLVYMKGVVVDITDVKKYEIKFKKQLELMDFALKVSRNFINIVSDDFLGLIRVVLEEISDRFELDRVSFVKYTSSIDDMEINEVFVKKGFDPLSDRMIGSCLSMLPTIEKKIQGGYYFYMKNPKDLPPQATEEKNVFADRKTTCFLGVPVIYQSELLGMLSLESLTREEIFDKDRMVSIRLIAELFSNVIVRRRIYVNLMKAREESDMANRAKTAFLANISHELRTPLNGILGFTDLLSDSRLDTTQKEYLGHVSVSAKTLMEIISNIVDFSKVESGKLELENSVADLHNLIHDSMSILQFAGKAKELKLNMVIHPEVPKLVTVDSGRLRQVLVNLLSNAVKFTERGEVSLEVSFEPIRENIGAFHFQVKDTGIGLTLEHKARITKSLMQSDTSNTRRQGGSGLGLVIANSILELAGSKLEFESEFGKGSKFFFTVNLEYFHEYPSDVRASENGHAGRKSEYSSSRSLANLKVKILIAEDVEMNLMLVRKLLVRIMPEATILEARNGIEVVDKFTQEKPDMIFMDVQMPIMDGLVATHKIRELEAQDPYKTNVPIVALTAGATREELNRSLQAGMDDCITKPIDKDALEGVCEKFLQPRS